MDYRPTDYRAVAGPQAERLCAEHTLWIGGAPFLGPRQDMDDIAEAVVKVKANADELAAAAARV